jgi:tRNA pseudouridine55 synthase
VDGLFLFDKPQGITSHDAVARARRWFGTRRVGHTGTLDPMASGLLILCINAATRMSEYLLGADKCYAATVQLGVRTNTDDAEGEAVQTRPVPALTAGMLADVAARFTGDIEQIPPQFSAIKRNGVRAYVMARAGETVEIAARHVTVAQLELASDTVDTSLLHMTVDCGSGTYIRALARDIGEVLGCGGHLTMLRRVSIGRFGIADALDNAATQAAAVDGTLAARLQPMDSALPDAPRIVLDDEQTRRILLGQVLRGIADDTPLARLYDAAGRFVAIARIEHGAAQPLKVFHPDHADADDA